MSKKPKVPVEIDFGVLDFYDRVEELLSYAGRYASGFKLRENLKDETTRHKVECAFERYYDGDMRKLDDSIHFRRCQCFGAIDKISRFCASYGIHQVKDKEILTDLLLDEYRRKGWRKLVKRHKYANQIVSLQVIELEYRASSQK